MIQLLFTVLAVEVAAAVGLLFKTPFRNLIVLALDRIKRGRGPVVVKTVAGTAFVVLASSLYSMANIRTRSEEVAALTPTDQVLLSRHLLEASLMGYCLFSCSHNRPTAPLYQRITRPKNKCGGLDEIHSDFRRIKKVQAEAPKEI